MNNTYLRTVNNSKGDRNQEAQPKMSTNGAPRRGGVYMDKALSEISEEPYFLFKGIPIAIINNFIPKVV